MLRLFHTVLGICCKNKIMVIGSKKCLIAERNISNSSAPYNILAHLQHQIISWLMNFAFESFEFFETLFVKILWSVSIKMDLSWYQQFRTSGSKPCNVCYDIRKSFPRFMWNFLCVCVRVFFINITSWYL